MKIQLNILAIALAATLASCTGSGDKGQTDSLAADTTMADTASTPAVLKPKGPKPAWGNNLTPEMQVVLEKLASYGDQPIPTLTPAGARKNHTPTDAVMDVMKENNIPMPPSKVDTTGKSIAVTGGSIHLRMYRPKDASGTLPVIVYYHGGGFVIADLDVYDAAPRVLAEKTGAVVVSVAYRLAPEHKFPTAHEDAFAAYQWVVKNAASINGDPKKIAVAGESAGGNLAVNMAMMARDKRVQLPVAVLAVYPVAGSDMTTPSYQKNAASKPLDKPMMEWFVKHYLNNMGEGKDPRINLVAANLKNLPPVTIITAEYDPLQSEGQLLAKKLESAGVTVDSRNYNGVTHEFFGMGTVLPEARQANDYAASALKKAFAQ
ncbi:alpha/beta hydrolase [Pedobacter sp. SYP-B3415]|uniref:alpha/beta hydrolase n=1 Tax=Pedobacter sp. SYP-B3415 TaxID=2496641 RepID=UPI00101C7F42|nr:alpha/beta hydrolase [Pedobacter sp. SYP-B3415]